MRYSIFHADFYAYDARKLSDVAQTKTGLQLWGIFDTAENRVAFLEEATAGCEDLLKVIVIETLRNRDRVYALDPLMVSAKWPVAALFRF